MYIGIDIGGTKCAVVVGDDAGAVVEKKRFETQVGPVANMLKFQVILEELLPRFHEVRSIGISCGGPLDSRKGIIQSPPNLPGWDQVPIVETLRQRFNIPVFLQNDANACALAEHRFGAGVGTRNMIFLTFGTGLGAGIILDGRLYEGTSGMAGEVGHLRLADEGPLGYGKQGSFEGFCSGGGIAQLAKQIVDERLGRGETVAFIPEGGIDAITARTVGVAAEEGDELARSILRLSGRWLGKGLAILIDLLNPEAIVIGSIFSRSRAYLEPAAEEVIRREALPQAASVCRLLPAALGDRIGDVAALSVAITGLGDPRDASEP